MPTNHSSNINKHYITTLHSIVLVDYEQ